MFIQAELKELIPKFMEITLQRLENIQKKLREQNYKDIACLSHQLAGTGGGYGFDRISEIGKSMEQAALESQEQTVRALADELWEYLQSIEIEYR